MFKVLQVSVQEIYVEVAFCVSDLYVFQYQIILIGSTGRVNISFVSDCTILTSLLCEEKQRIYLFQRIYPVF